MKKSFAPFIFCSLLLCSFSSHAFELSATAQKYADNPANYCMAVEPRLLDRFDLNKARMFVDLAKIGFSDSVSEKVLSATMLAVHTGQKVKEDHFNAVVKDQFWLDERSGRADGKVIVVSSDNGLSGGMVKTLYGPRVADFSGSGHSLIATEYAAKFKTCIPSEDRIRARGYLFELFNTEKSKTSGVFVSQGWAVADFVIPRATGLGGLNNHNLYLPPGADFLFWDPERGVMPRYLSGARALQEKNYVDGKAFQTKYQAVSNFNAESPVYREATPEDFAGFAPGGYELNKFLIEQVANTRSAVKSGKPVDEALAELVSKVEAFKKTLPPVTDEHKARAIKVRSGTDVPEDISLVRRINRPEPSLSIFSSYDKSQ